MGLIRGRRVRRPDGRSPSSAPLMAWSATREQETSFPSINRFVITPLFLFGGAFYPIEELPGLAAADRQGRRRSGMASSCAATPSTHQLELGSRQPCTSCTCRCSRPSVGWSPGARSPRRLGNVITLAELPLRILPPQVLAARRPQRMLERQWIVNRAGAVVDRAQRILRAALLPAVDSGRVRRPGRRRAGRRADRSRTQTSWRRRCSPRRR